MAGICSSVYWESTGCNHAIICKIWEELEHGCAPKAQVTTELLPIVIATVAAVWLDAVSVRALTEAAVVVIAPRVNGIQM